MLLLLVINRWLIPPGTYQITVVSCCWIGNWSMWRYNMSDVVRLLSFFLFLKSFVCWKNLCFIVLLLALGSAFTGYFRYSFVSLLQWMMSHGCRKEKEKKENPFGLRGCRYTVYDPVPGHFAHSLQVNVRLRYDIFLFLTKWCISNSFLMITLV